MLIILILKLIYNDNLCKKLNTFYKYRYMIHVQILKTIYKSVDPLSKNFAERYVFSPFLKLVTDGDLRRSNDSEFHSLGAHTEKALSP